MRYRKLLTIASAAIMSFGVVVAPLGQLANAAGRPGPYCEVGQTTPLADIYVTRSLYAQASSATFHMSGVYSTPCAGSGFVAYQWDLGDGTTSSEVAVDHTYSEGIWTPTFTVTNQDGMSHTTSVTIVVRATNNAPVAPNFEVNTVLNSYNATGPIDIISHASDPDGDSLGISGVKIVSVSDTRYSPVIYNPSNGVYTIRVSTAHVTNDVTIGLEYTAVDGFGASSIGTVTVLAAATNQAPVANDITITRVEDSYSQYVYLSSSMSDPDRDPLTISIIQGPTHGTISDVAAHAFSYQPNKDFSGTDTVVYAVTDGGLTSTGTVSIVVTPVNDTPVYNGLASFTTQEDTALSGDISSYVSDIDGDELVFESRSSFMTMNADGTFIITPRQDFSGTYYAEFAVTDPSGISIYRTFPVTVTAVNDAPVIVSLTYNQDRDGTVRFFRTVTDPDSSTYTYTWDFGDGTPVVTDSSSPVYHKYVKPKGRDAQRSFTATLTVDDGSGGVATKTVTINL